MELISRDEVLRIIDECLVSIFGDEEIETEKKAFCLASLYTARLLISKIPAEPFTTEDDLHRAQEINHSLLKKTLELQKKLNDRNGSRKEEEEQDDGQVH